MTVTISQIGPCFAGEVSGVDLTKPLSREEVAAIEAGVGSNITKPEERRLRIELADVSNLKKGGELFDRDDRRRMFNLGNRLWHSDSSFRATPAKYSLLSGRAIPATGGDTEFADMRAAYDALDAETKAEIEDLICEHSLMFSRGLLGFTEFTQRK